MTANKDNFKLWFCEIIEALYEKEHAGFPLLMLTFPLLERYIRSKSATNEAGALKEPFFNELRKLFPVLKDNDMARKFWHVYRNGILHQATLSQRKSRKDIQMPGGWLSGIRKDVEIDSNGAFWVNPVEFAKHVINVIDKDFSNFEATSFSDHPLATAQKAPDGSHGTSGSGIRTFSGSSGKIRP
jgi:hypothetical protein